MFIKDNEVERGRVGSSRTSPVGCRRSTKTQYFPPSKADTMDQGQTQVMAAPDVRPHTRITVTELQSLGETTFLWSHAGKVQECIQSLEGCVAGVPHRITFYLCTLPSTTKWLPKKSM